MLNLNFTPFPALKTKRILLRALEIEDAPSLFLIRSDASVNRFIDRPKEITIQDTNNFIIKIKNSIQNNESILWGINFQDNPGIIGTICFWNISKENDYAEIGYELLPAFQGRGIMNEAIKEVIQYGFQKMHLEIIEAYTKPGNVKSQKLLDTFNFTRKINHLGIDATGDKGDLIYKLTKQEWEKSMKI